LGLVVLLVLLERRVVLEVLEVIQYLVQLLPMEVVAAEWLLMELLVHRVLLVVQVEEVVLLQAEQFLAALEILLALLHRKVIVAVQLHEVEQLKVAVAVVVRLLLVGMEQVQELVVMAVMVQLQAFQEVR
jgi:hypothetical protein